MTPPKTSLAALADAVGVTEPTIKELLNRAAVLCLKSQEPNALEARVFILRAWHKLG